MLKIFFKRSSLSTQATGNYPAWPEEDSLKIYIREYCLGQHLCLKKLIEKLERDIIFQVLKETNGNQRNAAQLLGLKPNTLHYKIRKMGIVPLHKYMIMENSLGSKKAPVNPRDSDKKALQSSHPRL